MNGYRLYSKNTFIKPEDTKKEPIDEDILEDGELPDDVNCDRKSSGQSGSFDHGDGRLDAVLGGTSRSRRSIRDPIQG